MLLQFYLALYISKHFWIYCHLPEVCFFTTPFGTCSSLCITLCVLCSGLHFCFCLLIIHITFPSFKYYALQYSFCSHWVFSSLSFTNFVFDLYQQPFWIPIKSIFALSAAILNFYFSFAQHRVIVKWMLLVNALSLCYP